jgi:hypothetical protein
MAHHTQNALRVAEAQKPYATPTPARKDLAVLLLITRADDPKSSASATWLKDIGPWRCVDCSMSMAWMRKAEVKEAHARLKREGYMWEKFEGVVRVLS